MQETTKTTTDQLTGSQDRAAGSARRSPRGLFALAIVLMAASATYLATRDDPRTGDRSVSRVQLSFADQLKIDAALIHYRQDVPIDVPLAHLRAIDVGPKQTIYVAGDQAIQVFDPSGELQQAFALEGEPTCLGVGGDEHNEPGRMYVGIAGGITVLQPDGRPAAAWPAPNEKSTLTSIAVAPQDVFVSDAGNRLVWRFNLAGELLGQIGQPIPPRQTPSFVVTSLHFDLATGSEGLIHVANPGRLQIATYTYQGDLGAIWGRANSSVSGFFGCCNPAHFAVLPDGRFVTSEKGIPRIKVYDQTGRFQSVVAGFEQLEIDPQSVVDPRTAGQHSAFDVATDAQGRILVLDPRKKVVRIFVPKDETEKPRDNS